MEPPSAAPQDSPPYDTQLSFYGPGALACWYLALLCALLTWALHATDRFTHLKLTPDIAFYALYACLAAGHMAVQISRFSDDDIRRMCDAKGLGWNDTRYHDIDVLRGMEPGLREMPCEKGQF
ncbi:hypothetical protein B0T18DRAFT_445870 [Schizothecium vesticola]|uniref:Uncharacterized protein n=1 Tax=Schizothecium vesticola TaxID=314040 RepID=A0AA40F2V8_9PEZI|nr:hypothetical protein B0T18DRAFT_445870 [Schizothecium vesticola]